MLFRNSMYEKKVSNRAALHQNSNETKYFHCCLLLHKCGIRAKTYHDFLPYMFTVHFQQSIILNFLLHLQ